MLFRIFLVSSIALITIPRVVAESNVHTIAVSSPRALEASLELLQLDSGRTIHFEDAPYTEITRIERPFPGASPIPKSKTFLFKFDSTLDVKETVIKLLGDYEKVDKSATFELLSDPLQKNSIYVAPTKFENTGHGNTNMILSSILNKRLSINIKGRSTFRDSMWRICNKSSTEDLLLVPSGLLQNTDCDPHSFTNKSARYCLAYIIDKLNDVDLAWSVRRGPPLSGRDLAVLNFYKQQHSCGLHDVFLKFEAVRPLLSASKMLARLRNRTVIYEDIEYACPCSIMRDKLGSPQMPRGGIIEFSFHSASNDLNIFETCVETYNRMNETGDFEAEAIGESIYVFPILALDTNSVPRVQDALLSQNVNFPAMNTTFGELLVHLADTIALASDKSVSVTNLPSELRTLEVSIPSFENKPISHIFSDISEEIGENVIWELLYLPNRRSYVLGVEYIENDNSTPIKPF